VICKVGELAPSRVRNGGEGELRAEMRKLKIDDRSGKRGGESTGGIGDLLLEVGDGKGGGGGGGFGQEIWLAGPER